jgi:tetratricopeptide (TPR) repeat protein
MTVSEYLEQFKQQYPNIRPYEEEDDLEWWNQGMDLIQGGRLDEAAEIFKKLVLAQPEHSDGFNGLGLVYEKKGDPTKAALFLQEAISKAEQMVKDGDMDVELLDMVRADLARIRATS